MMKLKVILLVLLLLGSAMPLWAQTATEGVLKVTVLDAGDKRPVADVVCRVLSSDGQMVSYVLTDGEGRVELPTERGMEVSFSLINYARVKLPIDELRRLGGRVELTSKPEQLREVQVNAPPIKLEGDTLKYNAGSFVSKGDKYLEDLLRKLPGITISKTGHISYQGEPISKFYIEGQDLLGHRYNQATRNMSVEAVAQVQVLENHQNVRALKGKVFTDKAALNIKLKDSYKVRPFGEVALGGGVAPEIWNNRLFTAIIGRTNQMMITGKMNNSGTDLSTENIEHFDLFNSDLHISAPEAFVSQKSINVLPDFEERFLFNNAKVWSINDLQRTGETSHIRLNLSGYADKIRREDHSINKYGGPMPVEVDERNRLLNKAASYNGTLFYELNSDKTFLSNELSGVLSSDRQEREVLSHGTSEIRQSSDFAPRHIQNTFNATFTLGEQIFVIKSRTRYHRDSEHLDFVTDKSPNAMVQELKRHSWVSRNFLNTSVPLWGNHRVGMEAFFNLVSRDFESVVGVEPKGHASFGEIEAGVSPSYRWKYANSTLSLSVPLGYISTRLDMGKEKERRGYWFVMPEVDYHHRIGGLWQASARASFRRAGSYESFYAPVALYRDYRSLHLPLPLLRVNSSASASSTLRYKDLAEMLFGHLLLTYTVRQREAYTDVRHEQSQSRTEAVRSSHLSHSFFALMSIDKTFTEIGLGIRGTLDYNFNKMPVSRATKRFDVSAHMLMPGIEVTFRKWENSIFSYTLTSPIFREVSTYSPKGLNIQLRRVFYTSFGIGEKWQGGAKWQHSMSRGISDKYEHHHFCDAYLTYTPTRRVDLSLKITNLFDHNRYSSSEINDIGYHSYEVSLRPREFLLSCLLRF